MSTNIVNQVSYLQVSRNFPEDPKQLLVEINKSWVDSANAINSRVIGIFSISRPNLTGESWFINKNQRQQSLRQVYTFTSTASIPHGIVLKQIDYMVKMYGQYTDGTNWYGLIAGSTVAIPGQISFYVDPTNIVFLTGAGAPALTKGVIVLEWLSQV